MTVFKTFLKVLNKNKFVVILYTIILLVFGGINMQTSENSTNFVASKPNVLIINNDESEGISKNLSDYIEKNTNIVKVEDDEEAVDDALFYRDVSYIVYIPKNYRQDVLNGKNPEIEIKSAGDYGGSYAEMILSRYIKVQNIYAKEIENENELIEKINETLSEEVEIQKTTTLDTNSLSKATFYYNFANYSILAGTVYVICLVLSSFREEKVRKRTIVSSMSYKKHNRILLLANGLFATGLWLLYVILSFVFVGDIIFSTQGIIYIINSFVFTICALTIAFLIGTIVNNKNAINGIVNVVALGSSFLCGAFVPMEWLPDVVLKIAHILPSYYYISNNEIVANLETVNFETMKPILTNMGIMLIFGVAFIIITNVLSKRKIK